jgi:glycosyltransferase involved in cell wall biosynthesis
MFSIIIPTRNRGPIFHHCLQALLKQDFPARHFEILVVDDESDSPVEAPSDWPADGPELHILRVPHAGPAAARNIFTDDDCRPSPHWLSAFAAAAHNPDTLLAGATENGEPSNACAVVNHTLIDALLPITASTPLEFYPSNNIAIHAAAFLELAGFDESFPSAAGEDREFCERWRRSGRGFTFVPAARITNHHAQSLFGFLAMHRRYGQGARRLASKRSSETHHINHPALTASLLSRLSLYGFFLYGLSQVAVASGYFQWSWRALVPYAAAGLAYLSLVAAALFHLGAFQAEFLGFDESAHVVTSLMVHQYVHDGLWAGLAPLSFARDYYDHYPKVAIGHWPPGFYIVQSVWLALTGVSRASFLLLSSLLAALLGLVAVWLCRRENLPSPLSFAAGAVTALSPSVLANASEVMSDSLAAICLLVAAILCRFWLPGLTLSRGLAFAAASAAAALVKGNAFCFALLPPLALAVSSRIRSLLLLRAWLPLLAAAVFLMPWYLHTWDLAVAEVFPLPDRSVLNRFRYVLSRNSLGLLSLAGPPMAIFAALSYPSLWPRWPAMLSVPPALFLFLTFLSPHTDLRLFLATVPVLCFAAACRLRSLPPLLSAGILLTAAAAAHFYSPLQPKSSQGFVQAASWARSHPAFLSRPVLVASNAGGEGAWIAELALHSPSPQSTTRRASKILASSDWMGQNRRLLFQNDAELRSILASNRISSVVLHHDPAWPDLPHLPPLRAHLASWQKRNSFGAVTLFQKP